MVREWVRLYERARPTLNAACKMGYTRLLTHTLPFKEITSSVMKSFNLLCEKFT